MPYKLAQSQSLRPITVFQGQSQQWWRTPRWRTWRLNTSPKSPKKEPSHPQNATPKQCPKQCKSSLRLWDHVQYLKGPRAVGMTWPELCRCGQSFASSTALLHSHGLAERDAGRLCGTNGTGTRCWNATDSKMLRSNKGLVFGFIMVTPKLHQHISLDDIDMLFHMSFIF